MPRSTTLLGLLALSTLAGAATAADPTPDPLPRRGFFGSKVGTVSAEGREAAGLDPGAGVVVLEVIPGSTAEALDLKDGDIITAVDGEAVQGPPGFVGQVGRRKAGEPIRVAYVREGEAREGSTRLNERPRETVEGAEVLYGSVASRRGRLRTLLTRPDGPPGVRRPALFVIQGLGGFSVEAGPGPAPYDDFIAAFTKRGYATFRVEKPGQGDSEGGPTRDADFEDELDGYRQGLKALRESPDVDPDRIVIFGHSMGGVMGPILAGEVPVRGVAVYGTVLKTWNEYLLENTRRQHMLAGDDLAEIDRLLRKDAAIQQLLLGDRKSPEEIIEAHPELESRLAETLAEGKYVFGRHVDFFRQLAATNLAEAWSKVGGKVLAAWGTADFVSTEADHAMIAALVNRVRPGSATFKAIAGLDHGFHPAESQEASYAKLHEPGPQPFDPAFLDVLLSWADEVVKPATP